MDDNDDIRPLSRADRVRIGWPRSARPGFNAWLRGHAGRGDPVGDLADDMKNDRRWPRRAGVDGYLSYLDRRRACSEAIDALLDAFIEFHDLRL